MSDTPKLENLTDLSNLLHSIDDTHGIEVNGVRCGFDMEFESIEQSRKRHVGTEHPCGTACCIGGWINFIRPDIEQNVPYEFSSLDMELEYALITIAKGSGIEMSRMEAHYVCYPKTSAGWNATSSQAADVIDHIANGGNPITAWEDVLGEG